MISAWWERDWELKITFVVYDLRKYEIPCYHFSRTKISNILTRWLDSHAVKWLQSSSNIGKSLFDTARSKQNTCWSPASAAEAGPLTSGFLPAILTLILRLFIKYLTISNLLCATAIRKGFQSFELTFSVYEILYSSASPLKLRIPFPSLKCSTSPTTIGKVPDLTKPTIWSILCFFNSASEIGLKLSFDCDSAGAPCLFEGDPAFSGEPYLFPALALGFAAFDVLQPIFRSLYVKSSKCFFLKFKWKFPTIVN